MTLTDRQRMEREIARVEAARDRLVRGYRIGPDDVRIGKDEYVGSVDVDQYQRLGFELTVAQLRLDDMVSAPPRTAEKSVPELLDRVIVERDRLAAIPRRARTPSQHHALSVARRHIAELEAVAAAISGSPPETASS